jgi:hypothetical protein
MDKKVDDVITSQLLGNAPSKTRYFLDKLDTEKRYKKNIKKYGDDWYYTDKNLSYITNSNGFRTIEFKKINWANSIVAIGDSFTFGEGSTIEDVWTSVLQDMIGMPVINLGIGGIGIDRCCWNSLALHENYPKPKALIQLWSGLNRYSEYDYTMDHWERYLPNRVGFCWKHFWHLRNIFSVKTDRALWRDKLAYIEATPFEDTSYRLEIDYFPFEDYGRDDDHWGPKTHKTVATYFKDKLKEQGIK